MSLIVHEALGGAGAVETPFPDSRWVVLKFGGRSVATADNWATIARLIRQRIDEGVVPVVCHSALAGISNALFALLDTVARNQPIEPLLQEIRDQHTALAAELGVDPEVVGERLGSLEQLVAGLRAGRELDPRSRAQVLAVGELAATELGAAYLELQGLRVHRRDARGLLESIEIEGQTERARFLAARCDSRPDADLQRQLASVDGVVLTQGFIARDENGDTVLLGRGGSDTSGAYLAAKLEARRLEIWTDVPGFYSADPQVVPSARLIRSLRYEEAQEIASAGGGILHPRSISPVRRLGIPLFLKCTAHPVREGTVVSGAGGDDHPQLKAISHRTGITLLSMESLDMWHQVGFLAQAFGRFRDHGISVDLISTAESNVTVSIDIGANVTDAGAVEALADDLRQLCRVTVIEDCAAVTLVGRRIRTILHDLSSVLEVFEEQKVHLVTQAANDLNLTFVVESEHAYRLVQRIHGLLVHRFAGGVFGPTWEESVGPERPPTPTAEPDWWQQRASELIHLAREHGASYVYDSGSIRDALDSLHRLAAVDAVYYSMKANPHPEVLRIVEESGANFECVSPGEVSRVFELFPEIDRRRILFTPSFAPRAEYEWALDRDVWLTLDNVFAVREWGPLFHGRDVFVRVDTGQGRGHHEHVRTAGAQSKFGVPLSRIDEFAELVGAAGCRVVGLHAHAGSGVLTPRAWHDTGQRLVELLDLFPDVEHLDVGGGLGIPERRGQRPLDLDELDRSLALVKEACGDRRLWLEPGRFIVAAAGVLLARVTQTKSKENIQYVGVETGMNSLIRPALYGAYHEIVNLSRLDEPATEVVTVVGPICETGDRLGSDRLMPRAREGDVLLVANAGAYGHAMSSDYNLRAPAAEIVI